MIILIECLILIIIFTLFVFYLAKDPIKTLYNYPPKVIEKVKSLKEYQDKIPTKNNQITSKLIVSLFIIIIISFILRYVNHYQTFLSSFKTSFLIFTIINIYDVIVLDLLWFCQSKKFIFKGTEDIKKEYKNYWFHIKEGLIGEVIGFIICFVASLVVQFIL